MADTETNTNPAEEELIEVIETPDGQPPAEEVDTTDENAEDEEHDDEDERLGDNEEAEDDKPKRKRRSHAERNAFRKQQEAARLQELAELRQFRDAATQRLAALENNAITSNAFSLEQQLQQARNVHAEAERVLAAAIEAGNGPDAAQALRYRDAAAADIATLTPVVQNLSNQRQQLQQQPAADPTLQQAQQLQQTWRSYNSWYSDDNGDAASNEARRISNQLVGEGLAPSSIAHWQELTRRINAMAAEADAPPQRNGRKGPPVSAQRGEQTPQSSANRVYLSPERVAAIKDAGAWDDPAARNRYIKAYQKYDRENAGQGVS